MKKVVLSVVAADAIDFFKNPPKGIYTNWDNRSIIDCVLNPNTYHEEYESNFAILRQIPFDVLIAALYAGYEKEETPSDRIRDAYKKRIKVGSFEHQGCYVSGNSLGFADGIKFTLNELGVKIDEVNS